MNRTFKNIWILILLIGACMQALAHNGKLAYVYPLGKITVDGDLSDWPKNIARYPIGTHLSDTRPLNASDFSGFFQMGYRLDNLSLYIAFIITDDDFLEDTTENVRFNTQDCLELCLDARHLPTGSGVASFMYSKKLRNTNHAAYDPFASAANWDMMEVVMTRNGNTRIYEWRINLGDQLIVGKSIGLDFLVFDKDRDNSFSFTGWGGGGSKYQLPGSLGDVILLPSKTNMATISGNVAWERSTELELPRRVRIVSQDDSQMWLQASLDSAGNYSVSAPAGKYAIMFPEAYFTRGTQVYATSKEKPVIVAKAGQTITVPRLTIPVSPVPDLIPDKGILHNFSGANARDIDQFITMYQAYYNIPGVSLAVIRDGRVVYHKTYGVRNTITGIKVDSNTLFEAASVTKPVFAFAVQRLAERGIIDLDRPLYHYLPYRDIEYDDRYKLITARHVLTHRTGFPNWRSMNSDGRLNIRFTPGSAYNYSGEGFEYLKMVVEAITGKKVEQVLQEEVIGPMGLYHTFFSKNDSLQRMVASGHYNGLPSGKGLAESPGMAYSMYTEAAIFARFMLYLLEQKGLKPATYDTMFQKHSDYNYDPGEKKPEFPAYMGMSLEIRETPFGKSFGHGGNNGDFKCKFEVYKDLKMGYAVFTNSNTSDVFLEAIRQFLVEGKQEQ